MTKDQNMIEKSLIDTFTMIKQHRNLQNTPQFWKGSQHSQEEEASQMREKKRRKWRWCMAPMCRKTIVAKTTRGMVFEGDTSDGDNWRPSVLMMGYMSIVKAIEVFQPPTMTHFWSQMIVSLEHSNQTKNKLGLALTAAEP
jgi:hypothetical protein